MGLLDSIQSPEDLKNIPTTQLPALCEEIRQLLLDVTSKNGGHLAPNLGVVELTVALHRVFSMPRDKIVWDVGHQSYVHKILTGRREAFPTLRQYGGLCGFPRRTALVQAIPAHPYPQPWALPVPGIWPGTIITSSPLSGMVP